MNNQLTAVIISLILAIAFITGAHTVSSTVIDLKQSRTISVKGYAVKELKSDKGILSGSVTVEGKELVKTHRELTDDRQKIKKLLNDFDLTNRKIKFSSPSIEKNYKINERGHETEELVNYRITQNFSLLTKDVEKIMDLSERLSELLNEGIMIDLYSPEYFYSKLDDMKLEMIGKATANATERATVIADHGKFRLGSISSVRVGIFQITPINSTEVSDYGLNDTSSIEKDIKSVVNIKYFIR